MILFLLVLIIFILIINTISLTLLLLKYKRSNNNSREKYNKLNKGDNERLYKLRPSIINLTKESLDGLLKDNIIEYSNREELIDDLIEQILQDLCNMYEKEMTKIFKKTEENMVNNYIKSCILQDININSRINMLVKKQENPVLDRNTTQNIIDVSDVISETTPIDRDNNKVNISSEINNIFFQ